MKKNLLVLLLVASLFSTTENEIIHASLRNSVKLKSHITEIRISAAEKDVVRRENSCSLSVSASMNYTNSGNTDSISRNISFGFVQPVIGGGAVSAAVSGDTAANAAISFEQPLLKNSFGNSIPGTNKSRAEYAFRIKKEESVYNIITLLSEIRLHVLDAYLMQEKVKMLKVADSFAQTGHVQTMERFRAGDLSPLDTLESVYNYGVVKSERMRAERDFHQLIRKVMELSGVSNIDLLQMDSVALMMLPDTLNALSLALESDPELSRFNNNIEILKIEHSLYGNRRLPELNAHIGAVSENIEHKSSGIDIKAGVRFSYRFLNNPNPVKQKITAFELEKQKLSIEDRKKKLEFVLRDIFETCRWAMSDLEISATNARIAEAKKNVALALYRQGQITTIDRMKSEQDWIESMLTMLEAESVIRKENVRLDVLTGQLLTKFGIDKSINSGDFK